MARETQTIEVHVLGEVTFRPLGKVEMERLMQSAQRQAASPSPGAPRGLTAEEIESALLVGKCLTRPKFSSLEEFSAAIGGHGHVLDDIAEAIRAASWPNQPAG